MVRKIPWKIQIEWRINKHRVGLLSHIQFRMKNKS